jgi:hypothetical protein
VLAWRLDVAEAVGSVIGQVAGGECGVRPAVARAGVPYHALTGCHESMIIVTCTDDRCQEPGRCHVTAETGASPAAGQCS